MSASRLAQVSLYWLTYKTAMDRPIGVLIIEAPDLLQARFKAAVFELDRGAEFSEGHALNPEMVARVPERVIGRMMPLEVAAELLRQIKRDDPIPKRPLVGSGSAQKDRRKRESS
jgi:hypothetical protein